MVGRVLLWTVVLLAPGGFLLVPVLAATSLSSRGGPQQTLRERATALLAEARRGWGAVQRYWTRVSS
jgi:hypothetical protein